MGVASSQQNIEAAKPQRIESDITDTMFTWSVEQILNTGLYSNECQKLPVIFNSNEEYFSSYVQLLIEETRSEISSAMESICSAPIGLAKIYFRRMSIPDTNSAIYDVELTCWMNNFDGRLQRTYQMQSGDIFALANFRPLSMSDLQVEGKIFCLASFQKTYRSKKGNIISYFQIKTSKKVMETNLYIIFLMNITTSRRVWDALHKHKDLDILKEIVSSDPQIQVGCCECDAQQANKVSEMMRFLPNNLNESQTKAIYGALSSIECNHRSSIDLIWGPPGTGKTKTISILLLILLGNHRTLVSAPTNVAVRELASRVVELVMELHSSSSVDNLSLSLGDIVLFGNKKRLNIDLDIEDIYLEHRVDTLASYFATNSSIHKQVASMLYFLENEVASLSLEHAREKFGNASKQMKDCAADLCTHLSRSLLSQHNHQALLSLLRSFNTFEILLSGNDFPLQDLKQLSNKPESELQNSSQLCLVAWNCLHSLKQLQQSLVDLSLPTISNRDSIEKFCLQNASLIFCTASSSDRLNKMNKSLNKMNKSLNVVIIDEAAQLKESESLIPLQLPDVKHAILIGDECQLSAIVNSKVAEDAGYGRSLFQRLSMLGHSRYLLNTQYRMHPEISHFPNLKFYSGQIIDASNCQRERITKLVLEGTSLGPYAFINISDGKEEISGTGHSYRNMVEVAVVTYLVRKLHKVCVESNLDLSIGVITPYTAQVNAIRDKLEKGYDNPSSFIVSVKSIDSFEGGEEDIIIFSTVRCNSRERIGFLSSPERTNVALTRARHCLWILGHEKTLATESTIWAEVINDAKNRKNFLSAAEIYDLQKIVMQVKEELHQLHDLLKPQSIIFSNARWMVHISDNFKKSFQKVESNQTKKLMLSYLLRIANGWRSKWIVKIESTTNMLRQLKVYHQYIIWSIDIAKEIMYTQVLKVWDVLPSHRIPLVVTQLDNMFSAYTFDYLNRCKERCLEGNLEVPLTWPATSMITKFRTPRDHTCLSDEILEASNRKKLKTEGEFAGNEVL